MACEHVLHMTGDKRSRPAPVLSVGLQWMSWPCRRLPPSFPYESSGRQSAKGFRPEKITMTVDSTHEALPFEPRSLVHREKCLSSFEVVPIEVGGL